MTVIDNVILQPYSLECARLFAVIVFLLRSYRKYIAFVVIASGDWQIISFNMDILSRVELSICQYVVVRYNNVMKDK